MCIYCVDSRFIFDTCSVHFMLFVGLLPKDMAVIVAVPLFQWESACTKITTSLHILGHKTRMVKDFNSVFRFNILDNFFKDLQCEIFKICNY